MLKNGNQPTRTARTATKEKEKTGEKEKKEVRKVEVSTVMETEISGSSRKREAEKEMKVRRETLQSLLEQCQRTLESLRNTDSGGGGDDSYESDNGDDSASLSSSQGGDSETAELCDLLKSRVESPNFLEKLGSIHMSVPNNINEEGSSWEMVSETDLWEGGDIDGDNESDQDGYVLVRQEDIVDGIACFMAAYLLSLEQTKEITPNQLQEALSKTFSLKKKKGKLQKAWDGSKIVYNVASWSATAIGIYQNPALFKAASVAFWTSCRVVSKLL